MGEEGGGEKKEKGKKKGEGRKEEKKEGRHIERCQRHITNVMVDPFF